MRTDPYPYYLTTYHCCTSRANHATDEFWCSIQYLNGQASISAGITAPASPSLEACHLAAANLIERNKSLFPERKESRTETVPGVARTVIPDRFL